MTQNLLFLIAGFVIGGIAASVIWALVNSIRKKQNRSRQQAKEEIMSTIGELLADAEAITGNLHCGNIDFETFRRELNGKLNSISKLFRTNMHMLDVFFVKYAEQQIIEHQRVLENPERRRLASPALKSASDTVPEPVTQPGFEEQVFAGIENHQSQGAGAEQPGSSESGTSEKVVLSEPEIPEEPAAFVPSSEPEIPEEPAASIPSFEPEIPEEPAASVPSSETEFPEEPAPLVPPPEPEPTPSEPEIPRKPEPSIPPAEPEIPTEPAAAVPPADSGNPEQTKTSVPSFEAEKSKSSEPSALEPEAVFEKTEEESDEETGTFEEPTWSEDSFEDFEASFAQFEAAVEEKSRAAALSQSDSEHESEESTPEQVQQNKYDVSAEQNTEQQVPQESPAQMEQSYEGFNFPSGDEDQILTETICFERPMMSGDNPSAENAEMKPNQSDQENTPDKQKKTSSPDQNKDGTAITGDDVADTIDNFFGL
ncbi:MAG: hypothetical protein ACLFQB_02665 [Chitinispirillaceae bacterium]